MRKLLYILLLLPVLVNAQWRYSKSSDAIDLKTGKAYVTFNGDTLAIIDSIYAKVGDSADVLRDEWLISINDTADVLRTEWRSDISDSISGIGGGSPGGSDTYVQFNNSGSFGGSADLIFSDATNVLTCSNAILCWDGGVTWNNTNNANSSIIYYNGSPYSRINPNLSSSPFYFKSYNFLYNKKVLIKIL